MSQLLYCILANVTATVHLVLIAMNVLAVPFLIVNEPFWIWAPLITFLVSPFVGGTYCIFNQLENLYRLKAGMPLIKDRLDQLFIRNK